MLVKNFNELESCNLVKVLFYSESPLRLAYLDSEDRLGLLTVEQIVLFTRVTQRSLEHHQQCIIDFDIINRPEKSKGGLTGILKNVGAYLALASRDYICLYEI